MPTPPKSRSCRSQQMSNDVSNVAMPMKWQEASFSGLWEDLSVEESAKLEQAHSDGQSRFMLNLSGEQHLVNLESRPMSITDKLGSQRNIRRAPRRSRTAMVTEDLTPSEWRYKQEDDRSRSPSPRKSAGSRLLDNADFADVPFEYHPLAGDSNVMDGDRIFVWRNRDWHPVSASQAYQINTARSRGETVFDVKDGPFVWTIDTTEKDGWVQINKSSGKRRSMRQSTTGCKTPSLARTLTSKFLCVPTNSARRPPRMPYNPSTGSRQAEPSFFPQQNELSLISRLREEWNSLLSSIGVTTSPGQEPSLTKEDLINAWVTSSGTIGREFKDLIEQSIADVFLKMDLTRTNKINEVKWLHYWLLENQAPSFHGLVQVNENLQKWLQEEPQVLSELLELFLTSCCTSDDAQLTAAEMRHAASKWISQGAGTSTSKDSVRKRSKSYLEDLLYIHGMEDDDEMLSYYDFMNHMLGREKARVQLYMYDLSNGGARLLSPLVGQQLNGIWHTSIVVHGFEYYFGGKLYEAQPGTTNFGLPTKVVDLPDETMRTREDFKSFLGRVLAHEFNAANYDVLNHNCNHFSDACSLFLLNSHIPEEILKQTDLMKKQDGNWAMQILRPILNRLLNSENASTLLPVDETSDEDAWARIGENTLVVWEHNEGWTRIARLLSKAQDSCTVTWLDVHSGELHSEFNVKWSRVQELPELGARVTGRISSRCSDPNIGGTFGARFHKMVKA